MTLSRPLLLALAGAVLVLVAFMATRSMRVEPEPPIPSPQSAPSPAAKAPALKAPAPSPAQAPADQRPAAERSAAPVRVTRALAAHRPIVLFFGQHGPADDAATRRSVAGLRRAGVTVAQDGLGGLGRYAPVIRDLGIAQAPATVVVDRRGRARVLEGYVDSGSLRQLVADARR